MLKYILTALFLLCPTESTAADVPVYLLSSFKNVPRDVAEPILNIHPNYLTSESAIASHADKARKLGITTVLLDVELGKKQSPLFQRLKAALGREDFSWEDRQREPFISIANNIRCESAAILARVAPDLKSVSYLGGDLLSVPAAVEQLDNLHSPDRKHRGILRYGTAIMPEIYRSKGQLADWLKWEPLFVKRLRDEFPGQIYVGFEVRNWVSSNKEEWRTAAELMERWEAVEPYADGIVFGDFYHTDAEREFDPEWGWVKFVKELNHRD